MNKKRDNEIARDIIDGKITALYCIKEGFDGKNLYSLGQKYKVWINWKWSPYISKDVAQYKIYWILTECDDDGTYTFVHDTPISEYFETSFKEIRKRKLKKLKEVSI